MTQEYLKIPTRKDIKPSPKKERDYAKEYAEWQAQEQKNKENMEKLSKAMEFVAPRTSRYGLSLRNIGKDIADWTSAAPLAYADDVISGQEEFNPIIGGLMMLPVVGGMTKKGRNVMKNMFNGSAASKRGFIDAVPFDWDARRQRDLVNEIDTRLLSKNNLSDQKVQELFDLKKNILEKGELDFDGVRQGSNELYGMNQYTSPKKYREDLRANKVGGADYFDEGSYYSTPGEFYEYQGYDILDEPGEYITKLQESIENTRAKLLSPETPAEFKPALSERIKYYEDEIERVRPEYLQKENEENAKMLDRVLGVTPEERLEQSNKEIEAMLDKNLPDIHYRQPQTFDGIHAVEGYDVDNPWISPFRISNGYALKALGVDAENATRAKMRELNRQSQSNFGKVENLDPPRKAGYTSPDSKEAFDRSERAANYYTDRLIIGNPVFSPNGKLLKITPFESGVQTKLITPENATDAAILRHRYSNYNLANSMFNKQIAADIKTGKIPGYKVKYVPYDNGTAAMIVDDAGNMYNPHDLFKEKYNAFMEANFPGYIEATKTPKRR